MSWKVGMYELHPIPNWKHGIKQVYRVGPLGEGTKVWVHCWPVPNVENVFFASSYETGMEKVYVINPKSLPQYAKWKCEV